MRPGASRRGGDELLALAENEGRIVLARDPAILARAPEQRRHAVAAEDPREQLREVAERFGLWPLLRSHRGFLTRCLDCNGVIVPAKASLLADRVPAHVAAEHPELYFCPRCERVSWDGSHVARMKKWVDGL
jgi:uncharacterized protein with PIN domain